MASAWAAATSARGHSILFVSFSSSLRLAPELLRFSRPVGILPALGRLVAFAYTAVFISHLYLVSLTCVSPRTRGGSRRRLSSRAVLPGPFCHCEASFHSRLTHRRLYGETPLVTTANIWA